MSITTNINTVAAAKTGAEVREPIATAFEGYGSNTVKRIKPNLNGTTTAGLTAIESDGSYDTTCTESTYFGAGNNIKKSVDITYPESVIKAFGGGFLHIRRGTEFTIQEVELTVSNGGIHYEYDLGTRDYGVSVYVELNFIAVKGVES